MRHVLTVFALLLPTLILVHLLVAPYTKVEESFHVQATHDILVHGFPSEKADLNHDNYDHFAFPGAVPRSAVGAAVLAKLSYPVIALGNGLRSHVLGREGLNGTVHEQLGLSGSVSRSAIDHPGVTKLSGYMPSLSEGINHQILARAILGLYNAFALIIFARGMRRSFGTIVAAWYLAFQASQFHLIYYASRPLSNMFACGLITLAMRLLLPDTTTGATQQHKPRLSLILLTIAGVIFRSELALLVATQTIFLLVSGRIRLLKDAIPAGLIGLSAGLLTTVLVDTSFWDRLVWPELDAFLFNVVSGQSSAWGTDPWYFYFLNALPRLLLNPLTYLLAIPTALRQPATRQPAMQLLIPSLSFVALYSFQPHKEWRFIIYTVPPLTAAAALGAGYIWTHRTRTLFARLASHLLILSTLAAFLLSNLILLPASAANYPGAHALNALHSYHDQTTAKQNTPGAAVYLGNLACQTGVTRFLQNPPSTGWRYDKTEDERIKGTAKFWEQFDYLLVEASSDPEYLDSDETQLRSALPESLWRTAETVDGFAGISILRPGVPADGAAERRLLGFLGGERVAGLYGGLRDVVRRVALRGWWVELRMRPKIKVLERVRDE